MILKKKTCKEYTENISVHESGMGVDRTRADDYIRALKQRSSTLIRKSVYDVKKKSTKTK